MKYEVNIHDKDGYIQYLPKRVQTFGTIGKHGIIMDTPCMAAPGGKCAVMVKARMKRPAMKNCWVRQG